MTNGLFEDLDGEVADAVQYYWQTRRDQEERQGSEEDSDRGFRAAVTGGGQLDGFANLVVELLVEAGVPEDWISHGWGSDIPGFFRPTKGWDLVVVADGTLLASIEFKSQAGPSFGNNFNNRAEEAIGNATDLLTAYEKEVLPSTRKPWLGYLMLLEEAPGSTRPVRVNEPFFDVDEVFQDGSYADRYQILCERLLRERLYDGTCLLLSERDAGLDGQFREPHPELRFRSFASDLISHAQGFLRSHPPESAGENPQLPLDEPGEA